MIDLHSHIIPDVDDGSSSFDESEEMLRMAYEDGIRKIVSTPHMFSQLSRVSEVENYRKIFVSFKKWADNLNIGIDIISGSENYFTSGLKEKLQEFNDILSINNGDYFLLEFPMNFIFPGTREFIFDVLNEGFIPVLCHPERNTEIQANISLLYEFVVAGALVQLDTGSIRGDFGTESSIASNMILKHNLAHVIASDCHDSKRRPPGLSKIKDHLGWMENEKIEMMLNDVPAAIINNSGIPDIGPAKDPSASGSVFNIFRRKN